MTSQDFAYWLQGYFELSNDNKLTQAQVANIKKHLHMVFVHELDKKPSKAEQKVLNIIHSGKKWDGKLRC